MELLDTKAYLAQVKDQPDLTIPALYPNQSTVGKDEVLIAFFDGNRERRIVGRITQSEDTKTVIQVDKGPLWIFFPMTEESFNKYIAPRFDEGQLDADNMMLDYLSQVAPDLVVTIEEPTPTEGKT